MADRDLRRCVLGGRGWGARPWGVMDVRVADSNRGAEGNFSSFFVLVMIGERRKEGLRNYH